MTPEKVVQNKIYGYLKQLSDEDKPVEVFRRQAGGFSYKEGLPDLYAVIEGLHVEIEVKRPGGQLRAMQEKWRDRFIRKNVLWICADNFGQFLAFIRAKFPKLFEKS